MKSSSVIWDGFVPEVDSFLHWAFLENESVIIVIDVIRSFGTIGFIFTFVTSVNSLVDHSPVDELGDNKQIEGG